MDSIMNMTVIGCDWRLQKNIVRREVVPTAKATTYTKSQG